jgi:EpsI family protein
MKPTRYYAWLALILAALAVSALVSNTLLFRQVVQGKSELTRNISHHIGPWQLVDEVQASASEIQGLETSDIIKRTYSDGRNYIELVVAYIAHSSRKSAHAQEACLRGAGAMVGSITDVKWEQGRLGGKLITIDLRERRQWVCYWYKIGNVYTADYLSSSLRMFLGGLFGKKQQGASMIRILTPETRGEKPEVILNRLQTFTHHLLPELEKNLP